MALVKNINIPVAVEMIADIKASYRAAGNRSQSEFVRDAVQARIDAVRRGEVSGRRVDEGVAA